MQSTRSIIKRIKVVRKLMKKKKPAKVKKSINKKPLREEVERICSQFNKAGLEVIKKFNRDSEKTLKSFEEKSEKITKNSRIILAKVDKLFKRATKYESSSTDLLQSLCKTFEKIYEVHSSMEETLMNVLLAIRQNESLQAWYPAHKGFEEMKVIGPHPSSIEGRLKNQRINEIISSQ